jgi:DNA-binding LytR/AlgR family response regulator
VRLRIAIVDDEELARAVVREYLTTMIDVEVVAECANGFEAVKAVSELQPDVLILDVQMPKLNGFEVLELVARDVAVIFVTAFDQYAIRAFEVHAVDYLLKPFAAERLAAAIDRVRERLGRGETLDQILATMTDVAEGVTTARSVRALAEARGVAMPITGEVDRILHEGKSPRLAVTDLMLRLPKEEWP